MDWFNVLDRIQAGEDEYTEFGRYRSFSEKDWQKSACAFANTGGGLIVLGVRDDRVIDGVPMDPEAVQERLTDSLRSGLSSPLQARLGRHQDPSGWVHWIEVARMRGPEPLRYKGQVYVRRGRSNDEPSSSELQELYNVFGLIFTEERVVPGTSIDDIELSSFRRYWQAKGLTFDLDDEIPIETDLFNREVLDRDIDGRLRVTLFGLLCFGKEPQGFPPSRNFWVDWSLTRALIAAMMCCSLGRPVAVSTSR